MLERIPFVHPFRAFMAALIVTAALTSQPVHAFAADNAPAYQLLDSKEQGVTSTDSSKGILTSTYDESARKDVLELDYTLIPGSELAVWAKSFPAGLSADASSAIRIGVKTSDAAQAAQISAHLELKGALETQIYEIALRSGWTNVQEQIEWAKIGQIQEARFLIKSLSKTDPVTGTLDFTLDFMKKPEPRPEPVKAAVQETVKAVSEKVLPPVAETPKSIYTQLDSKEQGITASAPSKGTLTPTFDEAMGKDVLEMDYEANTDSPVTLWTKGYPAGLKAENFNTAKLGVRLYDAAQSAQIIVSFEAQGSGGTQSTPLTLKSGWNSLRLPLDWNHIGALESASLKIAPATGVASAKGTLSAAIDFIQQNAASAAAGARPAFTLLDAGLKGVFNIGPSQGNVSVVDEASLAKDVWRFDYTLPQGSVVGVWSKDFPAGLNVSAANAVRAGIYVPSQEEAAKAAVKIEVKGSLDTQIIPLQLQAGWNSFREFIRWNKIGELREFVFVVSPMIVAPLNAKPEDIKPVVGSFLFDFDFYRASWVDQYSIFVKIALALAFAWLLSLAGTLLPKKESSAPSKKTSLGLSGRDLFAGLMIVFILAVATRIYSMGLLGTLDSGFNLNFLWIGLAGAVIAELLKFRLTGKHLTAGEIFQNALIAGLLAACSTREEVLQAPASWGEILTLSKVSASLAFVIYQIFNANSLLSSGKHLKGVPATAIIVTPYVFGWILLLENPILLAKLGLLSFAPAIAEWMGRVVVLFILNEIVANGFSILTKSRLLQKTKAHLWLLVAALGAAASPVIATLGSSAQVAAFPWIIQAMIAILTTAISFAGLWGEVYILTGILLDAGKQAAPTETTIFKQWDTGSRKGLAYSGILMTILYALHGLLSFKGTQMIMTASPALTGIVFGALLFPFVKTIIETFDGSLPFFERTAYSYRSKSLWMRGAVVGYALATMISGGMFGQSMSTRVLFGLGMGFLASGGVSLFRDIFYALRGQGRVQSWRLYFSDSMLGIFVGSALAFYLDAAQVPVVVKNFQLYTSLGLKPEVFDTIPLVMKWGTIHLGTFTGGPKLLWLQSIAGVINWAVAAWLFAINKAFLQAWIDKDASPIKTFFSKTGFALLVENMIYVLRWGLWMSPIIATFLRMMPDPTWYNQDGAIRTLIATWQNVTLSHDAFRSWSLQLFISMMAFDILRVLIWMDHMGLRVATLVNLSFLGMDKLDEKMAKFIGPAAAQRYIPEGVKRFTTWAPLLIPFYIPRGAEWEYAWSSAEAIQNANRGHGFLGFLQHLSAPGMIFFLAAAVLVFAAIAWIFRRLDERSRSLNLSRHEISNREYRVTMLENSEVYSELTGKECDISRRAYDSIDPTGRILFIVDTTDAKPVSWPIMGNFPRELFPAPVAEKSDDTLRITQEHLDIRSVIEIGLPDSDSPAELWQIRVENLGTKARKLKVVTYLEWVLNGWMHDRFHTQYARLYPEMEYISASNAILSWQKSTKSMGFIASDAVPEGFLSGRVDFIGRAGTVWAPRALETFDFLPAVDTPACPTFDPIASLLIPASVEARGNAVIKLLIGYSKKKPDALALIEKFLKPMTAKKSAAAPAKKKRHLLIGHGEVLPGTPLPYFEFQENGNKLRVLTPFTPRPFDHAVSNPTHSVMVTNRGLHTSCNGNSQQNRLTPDWPDTVTKEIPTEAIYLFDADKKEWFSPTYQPLNDKTAQNDCVFGVDGSAVFRMTKGSLSTELTVFVPTQEPTGVYLLKIKNSANEKRRLKVSPYFQMCLSFQPERSGPLETRYDKALHALFFRNPRNIFRDGWAFASMSIPAEQVETKRGRYFGKDRTPRHPFLVEKGEADSAEKLDRAQIAAFLGTVEVPARGETTVAIVLGQADTAQEATSLVQKYKNLDSAAKSLEATRAWWNGLMSTVRVETNQPEFDRYQNWLKYQALAERIWARKGFYQTSGAYGFRDQLQDTVNLTWMDPALARKQILLHASQQFVEGDVAHWFFTLVDGRSAFSCRSHASDNPLWLAWGTVEYLRITGDQTILDELAPYMVSEFPFAPLPKNKSGWGHLYHRTTRADTLYRHCMRSIDLVVKDRTGKHGLPLMGVGDWNDGLDEIGGEGHGESVWLGFFLYYILKEMLPVIEQKDGKAKKDFYAKKLVALKESLEATWRGDRYLRAFHDDGTEIGVKDSGIWEIDALTASWAVMSGMDFERAVTVFNTAISVLERGSCILLGWPALREDSKPYLGRSSKYPEGVRENGMYCHGVQWMVKAARMIAEEYEKRSDRAKADEYRATAYRLWQKISPVAHVTPEEIEIYGGQPNKQPADFLTTFELGRMIWNGYTGAAGWMLRQALEGVVGASLVANKMTLPADLDKPRGSLKVLKVERDVSKSPLKAVPA